MDVCFLSPALPRDDPADPCGSLAQRLAADHGVGVTIALTATSPPGGEARLGGVRAIAVGDLTGRFDIAIAVSWESTAHLFAVDATRHAYLVDGFGHHRLGEWQAERIAASISYDLPVDFLALGDWVAEALRELRPDARTLTIVPGLDRDRFPAAPARESAPDGPLRVLVDDRWLLEGADSAAGAALAGCTVPVAAAYLDPSAGAADRAVAYATADVLIRLDPVDGVLTSPLEAMNAGLVPLVLPAGGQADLVQHMENGIVADPDDARGTARFLDQLATDRALLERLRTAATQRVAKWPGAAEAATVAAAALETILAEDPPAAARWPTRLMADAMAGVAVYRADHYRLGAALERVEKDETYLTAKKVRTYLDRPQMNTARRLAGPLVRRAKRRLG